MAKPLLLFQQWLHGIHVPPMRQGPRSQFWSGGRGGLIIQEAQYVQETKIVLMRPKASVAPRLRGPCALI